MVAGESGRVWIERLYDSSASSRFPVLNSTAASAAWASSAVGSRVMTSRHCWMAEHLAKGFQRVRIVALARSCAIFFELLFHEALGGRDLAEIHHRLCQVNYCRLQLAIGTQGRAEAVGGVANAASLRVDDAKIEMGDRKARIQRYCIL